MGGIRIGLRAEPDDCVMLAAAASLGSFVSSQIERAVDVSVDVVDAASAWVVGAETDASLEDLKGREINGEAELREAALDFVDQALLAGIPFGRFLAGPGTKKYAASGHPQPTGGIPLLD